MVNLYDLTKGTYHMVRTITYPDAPENKLVTEAQVIARHQSEWATTISIRGTCTGPADVVAVNDYRLQWTTDGKSILERGSATLMLASGGSVRQVWSSTITPGHGIKDFPPSGEQIALTISPFQFDGNQMRYRWEGTVRAQPL